ncbi:Macrophage migration inhibitory factor-like protein [Dinothrombium tinctorium]|uniref:L-dopachrome isomerase n=1 Tax=Dinothrombium tinctorium TaxID=1965070 RepID=A0A443QYT9_9ACAR|nr:Macrophage migration inhibitory factor-like protein [Dinothrombium tinctorium]
MPCVEIMTNVLRSNIPKGFLKTTGEIINKLLDKRSTLVSIRPNSLTEWTDGEGPAAVVHLYSIGKINKELNTKATIALATHIEKNIGVNASRILLLFHDQQPENVGLVGRFLVSSIPENSSIALKN